MAHHVMTFDMREIGCFLEAGDLPVQMLHPCVQLGITRISAIVQNRVLVSDSSNVTFEMLNVNGIEANDGDVQTNVRLREFISEEIFPGGFREHAFKTIERFEQRENVILICLLRCRKSAFIHPCNQSLLRKNQYPLFTVS